jgi:hypothetical protein
VNIRHLEEVDPPFKITFIGPIEVEAIREIEASFVGPQARSIFCKDHSSCSCLERLILSLFTLEGRIPL